MAQGKSTRRMLMTAVRVVAGMVAYFILAVAALSLMFAPPRTALVVGVLIAMVAIALAAVVNGSFGAKA